MQTTVPNAYTVYIYNIYIYTLSPTTQLHAPRACLLGRTMNLAYRAATSLLDSAEQKIHEKIHLHCLLQPVACTLGVCGSAGSIPKHS